jgi:hypothetical protein
LSGTSQVVVWPAWVWGITVWPLELVPLTVTLQTTFVSLFWPPLVMLRRNVGAGLVATVFGEPVCRVVPLTLTEFSVWPCRPRAGLPPVVLGTAACSLEAMKLGVSHWTSVTNCPALIVSPLEPPTAIPLACSALASAGAT